MTAPLVILAFFAIFLGLVGTPFYNLVAKFLSFEDGSHHPDMLATIGTMVASTLIALTGIGLAYFLYGTKHEDYEAQLKNRFRVIYSLVGNNYWIDYAWELLVRKVLFFWSALAAFIDVMVIDRMVNFSAHITDEAGKLLRYEESGQVQHYGLVMVLSLVIISVGLSCLDGQIKTSLIFIFQNFAR